MHPNRAVLREATSAAHRRVDALFDPLDLGQPGDLSCFLAAHLVAYEAIAASGLQPRRSDLTHLCDVLRRDLILLGRIPKRQALAVPAPQGHASGIDYVLAGSHFGAAMLVRRLRESADARVRSATHYLDGAHLRGIWPGVVEDLSALDPAALQAATVAAGWTFAVFERAGAQIAGAKIAGAQIAGVAPRSPSKAASADRIAG